MCVCTKHTASCKIFPLNTRKSCAKLFLAPSVATNAFFSQIRRREGSQVRAHGVGDILYFGVGVDVRGKDPKGLIRINYVNQPEDVVNKPTSAPAVVQKLDADKITYQQTLAVETGFKDSNSWIDRMVQIIHQVQTGDCLICAKARPALIMGPTAFENGKIDGESGKGVACLIELMSAENPNATCKPWETIFPMAPPNVGPPIFKIGDLGNLTCFRNKNPANQVYLTGEIPIRGPGTPCGNIMDVTNTPVASKLTITRADWRPQRDVWCHLT